MKLKEVNWSTVYTIASCIGTIGTGVLASFGGYKIAENWNPNLTRGEKIKEVFKCQWPAMLCGVTTIAFDIIGHSLDAKTIAKLTAAVGAGAAKLNTYRDATVEEVGPEKESDICKRANKKLSCNGLAPDLEELTHRFYEPITETYFEAPTSLVLQAVNAVNVRLFEENVFEGKVSISDFLTLCNQTKMCNDRTDAAGWYNGYIEMGGMPCVKCAFDSNRDRAGRYWIICWGQGCEPEVDLELELWKDKNKKGA